MPTKAIWEGKECDVRVDTDLEANWSVSILSGEYDPVSLIRRPAAPVMIKLRAKTRWLAARAQGAGKDHRLHHRAAAAVGDRCRGSREGEACGEEDCGGEGGGRRGR